MSIAKKGVYTTYDNIRKDFSILTILITAKKLRITSEVHENSV